MSQLPVGTTAVKDFLRKVVNMGLDTAATAWLPALAAIPFIGSLYLAFVKWVVDQLLLDPSLTEGEVLGIALVFVMDREKFDVEFIKMSMLDKQGASADEREAALVASEKAMYHFVRRGPVQ